MLGRFIGTTAQSDSSRACASALWFITFADRSRSWLVQDVLEVSRFSCMLFLSVRGFFDYAGPTGHSRFIAVRRVAFPGSGRSQRSSIARPTDTPIYASRETSRHSPQDSGPRWSRSLLSCRALSSPPTCRFIPAHPVKTTASIGQHVGRRHPIQHFVEVAPRREFIPHHSIAGAVNGYLQSRDS